MPPVVMQIEMPDSFADFHLPEGVNRRLQDLLDRQDHGEELSANERQEAEGLVEMAEWLSLMQLRSRKITPRQS